MDSAADGTPPIRRRDRRRSDGDRAVDAALAVVERSLATMAAQETRPLLDPPPTPFRRRPLGEGGPVLFPVVIGAVGFGSRVPEAVAGGLLDIYRSSGGNAVLTSDSVSGRHGQEVVGRWLAGRRVRDGVVLGAVVGREAEPGRHAAAALTASVHAALTRLGAARLDLLVLDADDRRTPLEETLTAVAGLRDAGEVGALVLGDFRPDRLIELRVLAGQRGLPLVSALHVPYGLGDRGYERLLAPLVQAQDLALLPRRPLAAPAVPVRRGRSAARSAVAAIAADRRVAPAAVALAWLLTRPAVAAPVVAPTDPDDVAAALDAVALRLTRAEAVALEEPAAR